MSIRYAHVYWVHVGSFRHARSIVREYVARWCLPWLTQLHVSSSHSSCVCIQLIIASDSSVVLLRSNCPVQRTPNSSLYNVETVGCIVLRCRSCARSKGLVIRRVDFCACHTVQLTINTQRPEALDCYCSLNHVIWINYRAPVPVVPRTLGIHPCLVLGREGYNYLTEQRIVSKHCFISSSIHKTLRLVVGCCRLTICQIIAG